MKWQRMICGVGKVFFVLLGLAAQMIMVFAFIGVAYSADAKKRGIENFPQGLPRNFIQGVQEQRAREARAPKATQGKEADHETKSDK